MVSYVKENDRTTMKAVKKVKNVLIISSSGRARSNAHALCQEVAKGVKAPIQGFVDCFEGAKLKGFLKAGGVYEPGSVLKTKFMKEAFDLGKKI